METAQVREPVHIGKVILNALVFNFRNPRRGTVSESAVLKSVDRLFALLEERHIDYLLVGHIVLLQYVEGRNTDNIDLIISPSDLDILPELRKTGQNKVVVRASFEGIQINLLVTSNPFFDEVHRRHATRLRFVEREIPSATPEGLILLKLYALPSLYRQGDIDRVDLYENDILILMRRHQIDSASLFAQLESHLSVTDLKELRGIVAEIHQRIERSRTQFTDSP